MDPIFITQPSLYGNIMDDITNVNLGKIKMPVGVMGRFIGKYWNSTTTKQEMWGKEKTFWL